MTGNFGDLLGNSSEIKPGWHRYIRQEHFNPTSIAMLDGLENFDRNLTSVNLEFLHEKFLQLIENFGGLKNLYFFIAKSIVDSDYHNWNFVIRHGRVCYEVESTFDGRQNIL